MFLSMDKAFNKTNEMMKDNEDITKINFTQILSFINPSVGFTLSNLKNVAKFTNPLNVIDGIFSTLSVSKNSLLQLIDEKGITEIKLSDVLSSSLAPILSSVNGFLSSFGAIGVNEKHIKGFMINLLKVIGLNNQTIDKILQSIGFSNEKTKKITSILEKLNPVIDMIKIGFEFTVDKVRSIVNWIKDKIDEFYSSFFQLSPKEIFQSFLLPLFPPFVTDIAGRIANYFKEIFMIGARFLSRFVDKFFITPAKSFFVFIKDKLFKKKEEPSLLEKLIPKPLYETLKYAEELAQALGIKINPIAKMGVVGAAVGGSLLMPYIESKEEDSKKEGESKENKRKSYYQRIKEQFFNFKEVVKKEVQLQLEAKEKKKTIIETKKNEGVDAAEIKEDVDKINDELSQTSNNVSTLKTGLEKMYQFFQEKTSLLSNLISKVSLAAIALQNYSEKVTHNVVEAIDNVKVAVEKRPEYVMVQNAITRITSLTQNVSESIASKFKQIKEISNKVDKTETQEDVTHEKPKSIKERIVSFVKDKILGKDNICTNTLSKVKKFTGFIMNGAVKLMSFALTPFVPLFNKLSKFSLFATLKGLFGKKGLSVIVPSLAAILSFKLLDKLVFGCLLTETITDYVKKFFGGIWDFIVSIFSKIGETVQGFLEYTGISAIWERLTSFIKDTWNKIKEWFSSFEGLSNAFTTIKETLKTFIDKVKEMLSSIGSIISTVYDKIKSGISATFETVKNIGGTILGKARDMVFGKKDESDSIIRSFGQDKVKTSIDAIIKASSMTAIPLDVLLGMAYIESKYNYTAQSDTSTAKGLFQFIDSTWKEMIPSLRKSGFSDNVYDPYSNALAGALYIGKKKKYIEEFPPLVYVGHFLPNLAPYVYNALKTGQLNAPMGPLVMQAYDNDKAQADKSIRINSGLFPNSWSTTVQEFLQQVSQKFYHGVSVGRSLLQKFGFTNYANSISVPNTQNTAFIAQASNQIQTIHAYDYNKMTSAGDFRKADTESVSKKRKPVKNLTVSNIMDTVGVNNMDPYVNNAKQFIENNLAWQLLDISYKKA